MTSEASPGVTPHDGVQRSRALDAGRAVAVLLVAYVHWGEQVFGFVYAGNPGPNWPDLGARIDQWAARGEGLQGLLSTVAFRSSWIIEQAVGYFIVVTVVVLTLGALARGTDFTDRRVVLAWWYRRWLTLWPTWAVGHVAMAAIMAMTGGGAVVLAVKWWASLAGIRFWPSTMYYLVPAWWYVGMLFQLYAIFPLLIALARRASVAQLLLVGLPLSLGLRAAGLMLAPKEWLDLWARGGIVLSRLPDIIVGLAIAVYLSRTGTDPDAWVQRVLRRPWVWACAGVALIGGLALSFFVLGNALSPLLVGCAIGTPGTWVALRVFPFVRWIALHVFEFYVAHQVAFLMLVRPSDLLDLGVVARAVLALAVALGATWLLRLAAAPLRQALGRLTVPASRRNPSRVEPPSPA